VSYLNPVQLTSADDIQRTPFDTVHGADTQYAKGLEYAAKYPNVSIANNGVWSAQDDSGMNAIFSYETIGLHANTRELVRGFLDGGATITDYRDETDETGQFDLRNFYTSAQIAAYQAGRYPISNF
jgi:hypothetical protein